MAILDISLPFNHKWVEPYQFFINQYPSLSLPGATFPILVEKWYVIQLAPDDYSKKLPKFGNMNLGATKISALKLRFVKGWIN